MLILQRQTMIRPYLHPGLLPGMPTLYTRAKKKHKPVETTMSEITFVGPRTEVWSPCVDGGVSKNQGPDMARILVISLKGHPSKRADPQFIETAMWSFGHCFCRLFKVRMQDGTGKMLRPEHLVLVKRGRGGRALSFRLKDSLTRTPIKVYVCVYIFNMCVYMYISP